MPSLFSPNFAPVIQALPAMQQSIFVDANAWRPKFQNAQQGALHLAIFGDWPSIRITRERLLHFDYADPIRKVAEILLWGYPKDQRGIVSRQLANLNLIADGAVAEVAWPAYFEAFPEGLGISTITKLAYFHDRYFEGLRSLILDQRLIDNTAKWSEVAVPNLGYGTAQQLYLQYLQVMHAASAHPNLGCAADQLEFFLFSLGDAFGLPEE